MPSHDIPFPELMNLWHKIDQFENYWSSNNEEHELMVYCFPYLSNLIEGIRTIQYPSSHLFHFVLSPALQGLENKLFLRASDPW